MDGGVPHPRGQHLRRPLHRPVPVPHEQHRADQRPHHVVAERIGPHRRRDDPVRAPLPAQLLERADRGRALPPLAVGREVVLPQQRPGGGVHRLDVQVPVVPQHMPAQQRVHAPVVIGDPVRVPPPDRREPRVEPVRRRCDPPHPDVLRQPPGQPPQQLVPVLGPQLRRQIHMRHLPARVHPRVRPPGDGELIRLRRPRHGPDRVLQLALDRAPFTLLGPPGELRAVVRQVQPHPDETGLHFITHASNPPSPHTKAGPPRRADPLTANRCLRPRWSPRPPWPRRPP